MRRGPVAALAGLPLAARLPGVQPALLRGPLDLAPIS